VAFKSLASKTRFESIPTTIGLHILRSFNTANCCIVVLLTPLLPSDSFFLLAKAANALLTCHATPKATPTDKRTHPLRPRRRVTSNVNNTITDFTMRQITILKIYFTFKYLVQITSTMIPNSVITKNRKPYMMTIFFSQNQLIKPLESGPFLRGQKSLYCWKLYAELWQQSTLLQSESATFCLQMEAFERN
jgi:hypothetical protein